MSCLGADGYRKNVCHLDFAVKVEYGWVLIEFPSDT